MLGLGDAEAKTLLNLFLLAAPFTIAVTLIGLAAMNHWFESPGCLLPFSSMILFVSVLLGSLWGGLGKPPKFEGNWPQVLYEAVVLYWGQFGPALFLSSLILGVFLSWALTKLWPRKTTGSSAKAASAK